MRSHRQRKNVAPDAERMKIDAELSHDRPADPHGPGMSRRVGRDDCRESIVSAAVAAAASLDHRDSK